jgi:hypothetical protein
MAVSGSITLVSVTSTTITVSWYITGTNNFAEVYVTGNGQNLLGFDGGFGATSPVSGSATVTGLSPSTAYTFTWGALDGTGATGGASYSFSTSAVAPPVWIDNTIFRFAPKNGDYFDVTGSAVGVSATNNPTYSVIGGSLPPGIFLNSSTGAITGVATTLGIYNFTVRALNADGSITADLTIEVILAFSIGITGFGSITENSFTFTFLADNTENNNSASLSFSSSPAATIETPSPSTIAGGAVGNQTLSVTGLSPGTSYAVTATMSSGGDTDTDTQTVVTLSPDGIMHVKVNGVWKVINVYVKVDGAWKRGTVYAKDNGVWKVTKR